MGEPAITDADLAGIRLAHRQNIILRRSAAAMVTTLAWGDLAIAIGLVMSWQSGSLARAVNLTHHFEVAPALVWAVLLAVSGVLTCLPSTRALGLWISVVWCTAFAFCLAWAAADPDIASPSYAVPLYLSAALIRALVAVAVTALTRTAKKD